MILSKENTLEAIKFAEEVSKTVSAELRTTAFEVVLAHALGGFNGTVSTKGEAAKVVTTKTSNAAEAVTGVFNASAVASKLGISEEQVEELYEVKGDVLMLRIKPLGATLPDQNRLLAEVLMVGYKSGFNIKKLPQSKVLIAAEEWNVGGSNISRDLQSSKYVESKAGGKGKDPVLSLSPGSIEGIAANVRTLLKI